MHTQEAAEEILKPYLGLLAEPFPAAWSKWATLGEEWPEIHPHLSSRARASMIYDWAATRARTVLSGMAPAVRLIDRHGFLLIVVDDQLHIRLKKYRSRSLRTCGIPTQQQLAFASQSPLPGMSEATNLVLGYQLNAFQTEIERIAITCSTFRRIHWTLDLPIPGAAIVTRPLAPESPTEPSIRSKRSGDEEDRETGNAE